ncbi:hypothetical protein B0A52_05751 [Exophiala mesophila]|uniref:F-box domain-containing protein n=1 Tax=Exophiala mesophila TaxID=212818 RepID=A0A438N2G9_EXOME|nr:hypothetical protein B0A52_05751 [Exophiala mesophila]
MSLSTLPHELLVLTFQSLDPSSLRQVRLMNKACSSAAAVHLFHTIHLRPLHRSWRRIDCVSTASHLQKHVRSVHLNTDVLNPNHGQQLRSHGFRTLILQKSYTSISGLAVRTISEEQIDALYLAYMDILREQVAFESIRPTDIRSVLTSFPHLQEICCQRNGCDYEPLLSSFILSPAWPVARSPFRHFYRVCMSLQLESLTLDPLSWGDILYPFTQTEQELRMTRTQKLKLGLNNESFDRDQLMQPQHLKRLVAYLSLFSKLQHLSIHLGTITRSPRSPRSPPQNKISNVVTGMRFPTLKHVSFCSFNTEISPLLAFLRNHSATLRRLHLEDVTILPNILSASGEDSVMELFGEIRDACHLQTVTLSGTFTNLRDEAWEVRDDKKSPGCLCVKLEMYMARKGKWPIGDSPAHYQRQRLNRAEWLEDIEYTMQSSESHTEYLAFEVDDSWQDLSWQWATHLLL